MATQIALPTITARRISPIAIDGDLTKPAWQTIQPQWLRPTEGGEPIGSQSTSLRAAYTATHLYLAFHCADAHIWGTYTGQDDPLFEEEVVEAFLCPTGDVRHYYELEVSPRNVIFDATVYSPDRDRRTMKVDTMWDCEGIETAVRIDGKLHTARPDTLHPTPDTPLGSWSVEIAIPFAAFPEIQPHAPGGTWRANFYRIDRGDPPEFLAWSPTLEIPANFHVPNRFGFLRFE